MKKTIFLFLLIFLTPVFLASAEEPKKTLKEDVFSVSTEETSSADSLNRVAGDIDRGFSSPEQSYQAKEEHGGGPFAHEKAMTDQKNSY